MTVYDLHQIQFQGTAYHGLSSGQGSFVALHFHGTWDNFYKNPFALALADTYNAAGLTYASVNLPGHDGESMAEDFDDSLGAISAWVEHFLPANEGRLLIQGYSLGALKVLRWLAEGPDELTGRVAATVLLSPFDLVAFYGGVGDDDVHRRRSEVQTQVAERGEDSLVEKSIFDVWPIGAGPFLRATESGGPWDVFPARIGSAGLLATTNAPTMAFIGGDDFALLPSVEHVVTTIRRGAPHVHLEFVPGAPHDFAGHEPAVAEAIVRLLGQVLADETD
jgi:alpha-beta hydrolase superfamily lysophospholipase